jgi:hypothetical protein
MSTHKKSASVLNTPEAVHETKSNQISKPQAINREVFKALQPRFARLGFELQRVFRPGDLRPSYLARRWSQTHVFVSLHDLSIFLAFVEGNPL